MKIVKAMPTSFVKEAFNKELQAILNNPDYVKNSATESLTEVVKAMPAIGNSLEANNESYKETHVNKEELLEDKTIIQSSNETFIKEVTGIGEVIHTE